MNLMMLAEMAAQGFGDRTAFVNGNERLTYAELFRAAGAAAAQARASGAEHIAVLDISSLAVPVGLFASAWAGLPFVPLNYRLTDSEIEALIERVTPAYLVTQEERVAALSKLDGTTVVTREAFLEGARTGDPLEAEWSMEAEDIAVLLFTSGTTGVPKAAVLRHKHLVSYILGSVEFMGAAEEDATLVSVPPYHVAGMAAILSSVYAGRRIVQLPNFTAEAWLDLARSEHITNAFVVPTMLARIIDELEGQDSAGVPKLRALSYGGGRMPLPLVERAMRMFPDTGLTNAYGLTETSSTITLLGPEDHRAAMASDDPAVRRRLVSVGRALPGLELEVRDEDGVALGAGEAGEIYVRGEQVSGEYLGRGSNLEADGWFPTRDGGYVDDEGYVFIEGRIDDVIVRGGENMSPGEIEDVLIEHKAVADCAIVGVPSEQWGEAVAAAVVLKPGVEASAEELQGWIKGQLRSSRTPERIEFVKELPYNETGKLLRRKVRETLGESS
jgi:acyl-CoA synthetase (AMP-forming)/AMP-acid ligase II